MLDRKNNFSQNRCKDYSKRRNYSAMSLSAAFFLLITWFCAVVDGQLSSYWDSAFRGSYCGSRSAGNQCCQGRSDECTVPYIGTVCYCDAFCNRTHSPGYQDCCPDYPSICLGLPDNIIEPTKQCYFNGRFIKENEIHKINCNECKCELKGNNMALMCDSQECLINPTTMTLVNNQWNKYGWRARNYSEFWGRRLTEGIASRLGTILSAKKVLRMNAIGLDYDANRLPLTFDARKKWRGLIELPRDQGWCGASWAISTVAVISDRMKIQFPSHHAPLSPQHLLSCNTRNQPEPGCNGGHLTRAWIFIRRFGLVQEQCFPWVGHRTQCVIPKRKAANESRCVSPQMHRSPLYRVAPVYRISGERDIMYEIQRSGPVQATMRVHPDFFMYEGGVYKCTGLSKEQRTGFHSVRIIGWGEEYQNGQTVKYWIVANSWGLSWGEQGYFRIRRGNNDCKIEDFVLGAWAAEDKTPSINFKNKANIDNRLSNVI